MKIQIHSKKPDAKTMMSPFSKLNKLGNVKLSKHFEFRQFLYSEVAITHNIVNIPSDIKLAIEAGSRLCENILEPLQEKFGPIIIRTGYRSTRVNQLRQENTRDFSLNEKNYANHIWDRRDAKGYMGASACIILPSFNEGDFEIKSVGELALYVDQNLDYDRIIFFPKDNAFNIGWHQKPKREVKAYSSEHRESIKQFMGI